MKKIMTAAAAFTLILVLLTGLLSGEGLGSVLSSTTGTDSCSGECKGFVLPSGVSSAVSVSSGVSSGASADVSSAVVGSSSPDSVVSPALGSSSLLSDSSSLTSSVYADYESRAIAAANDKSRTRVPLRPANTVKAVLAGSGDALVYTVTLTSRGTISMYLTHDDLVGVSTGTIAGFAAVLLQSYSPDGSSERSAYRALTCLVTNVLAGTETGNSVGVLPGTYTVVLICSTGYSTQSVGLGVNVVSRGDYEVECNDSPERYDQIYDGLPVSGSSSARSVSDADWFLLRVTSDGYLKLSFEHTAGSAISIGWKLGLTDIDGNEIYSYKSAQNEASYESGAIGVHAGVYLISVTSHAYNNCDYTLTASLTKNSYFESERNDTAASADPLELSVPLGGACQERSGSVDRDYYSFDITRPGYISVTFLQNSQNTQSGTIRTRNGWNVSLISADGTLLYKTVVTWDTQSVVSADIGVGKGRYYVLVDDETMSFNSSVYSIKVDFTATLNCEAEPNNTMATATPLVENVSTRGSLIGIGVNYDTDLYSFTIAKQSSVGFIFSHTASGYDREGFILSLLDKNGKTVTMTDAKGVPLADDTGRDISSVSVNWNESKTYFTYGALPAGTYYLVVDTGQYFLSDRYDIVYYTES